MPHTTASELPKSPAGIRLPDLENELFAALTSWHEGKLEVSKASSPSLRWSWWQLEELHSSGIELLDSIFFPKCGTMMCKSW